jgi:mono/diheme cytochrome c family protein
MFQATVIAFGLTFLATAPVQAQDATERGRELVEWNCAGCHAVGENGRSPLAAAPVFRTLGQRYPLTDLEEALAEGIVTGHPGMPQFAFEADDVSAVIAYLEAIQEE